MSRYLKITLVDGTRFILRVTKESPTILSGYEVNDEGDEVVPAGYDRRLRFVDRSLIKKAVEMRMNPTYATLEAVPKRAHATRKSPAQLDAEIAHALARSPRQRTKLRPVEGIQIPADSRRELIRFWRAHPALRKGCLSKYGFDPIDEEADYWRFGLAEPDHRDVLRAVHRNNNVFSLPLVKRWEIGELRG